MAERPPTIRPATNTDAPAVRELIFSILREFGLPPDPDGVDADLKDIEATYLAPGGRFDVMVGVNGGIIGSVGLFRINRGAVELRKMYLAPQARGKGFGRCLLDHAIAQARGLGCTRITLETASQLTVAIEMYKRYGFRPTCGEIHVKRCDQAYELNL